MKKHTIAKNTKIKLGELLVNSNILPIESIEVALIEQGVTNERLGSLLVKQEVISIELLIKLLQKQLGLPVIDVSNYKISSKVLKLISQKLVYKFHILPLGFKKNYLYFASLDSNLPSIACEEIYKSCGYKPHFIITPQLLLQEALHKYYPQNTKYIIKNSKQNSEKKSLQERNISNTITNTEATKKIEEKINKKKDVEEKMISIIPKDGRIVIKGELSKNKIMQLIVTEKDQFIRKYVLRDGQMTLGSSRENDIVLRSEQLPKKHLFWSRINRSYQLIIPTGYTGSIHNESEMYSFNELRHNQYYNNISHRFIFPASSIIWGKILLDNFILHFGIMSATENQKLPLNAEVEKYYNTEIFFTRLLWIFILIWLIITIIIISVEV